MKIPSRPKISVRAGLSANVPLRRMRLHGLPSRATVTNSVTNTRGDIGFAPDLEDTTKAMPEDSVEEPRAFAPFGRLGDRGRWWWLRCPSENISVADRRDTSDVDHESVLRWEKRFDESSDDSALSPLVVIPS